MSDRHYDPFGTPMCTLPPAKKPKKRRPVLRFLLWSTLLFLMLAVVSFSSVCLYVWFTGHQVDLTGRPITFHQIRADRENALSVPEVYDQCRPWVVTLDVRNASAGGGYGTGIVISEDGYILTCAHVIEGENASVIVETADGTAFDGQIVAVDRQTDVGILKIAALGMEPAVFGDSAQVIVGETAIALGNPLGRQFAASLTCGILSARERTVTIDNYVMTLLQFDAAVSPGNSGGPLLNSLGQVIGMVNAKIDDDKVEGIGFAIPIDQALDVAEDLIEYGYVQQRPWLGITIQEVPRSSAAAPALMVIDVTPGGSAHQAGLQVGDWILAFNDKLTPTSALLNYEKDQYKVGDTVELTILRDGVEMILTCVLQAMPAVVE